RMLDDAFFFFKQKTAYEMAKVLAFRRVLFRSVRAARLVQPSALVRVVHEVVGSEHRCVARAIDPERIAAPQGLAPLVDDPRRVEIGRASCRERVWGSVGEVGVRTRREVTPGLY